MTQQGEALAGKLAVLVLTLQDHSERLGKLIAFIEREKKIGSMIDVHYVLEELRWLHRNIGT